MNLGGTSECYWCVVFFNQTNFTDQVFMDILYSGQETAIPNKTWSRNPLIRHGFPPTKTKENGDAVKLDLCTTTNS
jgi:hypothetical protein